MATARTKNVPEQNTKDLIPLHTNGKIAARTAPEVLDGSIVRSFGIGTANP